MKAQKLNKITPDKDNGKLSHPGQIKAIAASDEAYGKLAIEKNALIDHIEKDCQ